MLLIMLSRFPVSSSHVSSHLAPIFSAIRFFTTLFSSTLPICAAKKPVYVLISCCVVELLLFVFFVLLLQPAVAEKIKLAANNVERTLLFVIQDTS